MKVLEKSPLFSTTRLTTQTLSETTSLAPVGDFRKTQQEALSVVAILDISTSAILVQPDFAHLAGVDQLPVHQKSSKESAKTWREIVRPYLFSVNDAIINFNTQFNSFYDPLYEFAGQLSDPSKCADAQANLIAGLTALQQTLQEQQKKVSDASEQINHLATAMLKSEADLNGDLNQIQAKYTGDTGMISDLKNKIEACNSAMSNDLALIGGGAGGIVVGGLTVVVGVALWIESAGCSTPVIAAGVTIIAGGAGALGYGIYDYNNSSNRKAEATRELASINAEIAVATSLKSDVSSLVQQLDNSTKALDQLSMAWNQLDRDYDNVIEALKNTEGSVEKTSPLAFIVQANLRTSKEQWNILVTDAQAVKNNILNPTPIDTSALDHSDGKNPAPPNVPLGPDKAQINSKNAKLLTTSTTSSLPTIKSTGYTSWIESTAQSLFSFESAINDLKNITTMPAYVTDAHTQLLTTTTPALDATHLFLEANEALSHSSTILRNTAAYDDQTLLMAAPQVLQDLTAQTKEAIKDGQAAAYHVLNLEEAVELVDVQLSNWLNNMKGEQAYDKEQLNDVIRLRDQAQKDKGAIKKDYWYCFLGPIACAVVAIEANIRISNAQSEINEYNRKIGRLDLSLSELLTAINTTTALTGNAAALSKSIDGGLEALQYICATLEGIHTNPSSITPFILRGYLNALADQIEGIATIRLSHCAHILAKAIAPNENTDITSLLQRLTSASIMVHTSARTCVKQPKLIYVENLLKQDQALLSGNALEWVIGYSNNILNQLSAFGATGLGIKNLGTEIVTLVKNKDIQNATAGIDAIIDTFSHLQERLFNNTLCIKLFYTDLSNNNKRFSTVSEILSSDLTGDKGELDVLVANEAAYTAAITQSLSDIVSNSIRMVCEYLEWGAILAITIATGQIEFAAVEGPTLMYLVQKGANLAIKSVSDAGAEKAKEAIKNIESEGGDIDTYINERKANLEKISSLKADIAVLYVLLNDLNTMNLHTIDILKAFTSLKDVIQNEISTFYGIKYALKSSTPSDGLTALEETLKKWDAITKASDLLESNFMSNCN